MSHPRLSIIVPTLDRASLKQTLQSIRPQLAEGDEVLVIGDGRVPTPDQLVLPAPRDVWFLATPATRCWGNAQRDKGMEIATGTHLLFIDDDDAYEPDALANVRRALEANADVAHIFRIRFGPGHPAGPLGADHPPIWIDQSLRSSNIATPMVVLPNRPDLPRWADGDDADQLSDFVFIRRAVSRVGGAVWHEPVIATVRP